MSIASYFIPLEFFSGSRKTQFALTRNGCISVAIVKDVLHSGRKEYVHVHADAALGIFRTSPLSALKKKHTLNSCS